MENYNFDVMTLLLIVLGGGGLFCELLRGDDHDGIIMGDDDVTRR